MFLGRAAVFDHGTFRLIEEQADAPWPQGDKHHFRYEDVTWSSDWDAWSLDDVLRRVAAAPSPLRLRAAAG